MNEINEDFEKQFLATLSLKKVVTEYLPSLETKGRIMKGQCPFHKDPACSFHINQELGIYYCFECVAKGDAISFVAKMENLNRTEAIRTLAERFSITLPPSFVRLHAEYLRRLEELKKG